MKYGYVRVSTRSQFEKETYLKQIEILKAEGVLEDNIFIENVSGKNTKDRPVFNNLIEILNSLCKELRKNYSILDDFFENCIIENKFNNLIDDTLKNVIR